MLQADEVFSKAEEIERKGAKFYRDAAQRAPSDEVKRMLLDLAAMEDGHLQIFQQMREEFRNCKKNNVALKSDSDVASYIQMTSDYDKSGGVESTLEQLTGRETVEEIFRIAIEAENRSILFYVGLKHMVQTKADKDRLEAIIKEEMSHFVSLNLSLATFI